LIGRWAACAALALAAAGVASATPAAASAGASGQVEFDQIHRPARAGGSWSARLVAPARVTSRPRRGRVLARLGTSTTWSHQPQSLLILDTYEFRGRQWLKVLLPIRPSGSTGWIRRNRVQVRPNRFWIEVRKKNRWLVVYRGGRKIHQWRVVIGTPENPTPAGLAAIYERNHQGNPHEFLGPWSLPLTALSSTLRNFGGGPGRIALHGRGGASYLDPLGSAASHGCVRTPNRAIRWLARYARAGTPVFVRGQRYSAR
jgi:hypothetical protein